LYEVDKNSFPHSWATRKTPQVYVKSSLKPCQDETTLQVRIRCKR